MAQNSALFVANQMLEKDCFRSICANVMSTPVAGSKSTLNLQTFDNERMTKTTSMHSMQIADYNQDVAFIFPPPQRTSLFRKVAFDFLVILVCKCYLFWFKVFKIY